MYRDIISEALLPDRYMRQFPENASENFLIGRSEGDCDQFIGRTPAKFGMNAQPWARDVLAGNPIGLKMVQSSLVDEIMRMEQRPDSHIKIKLLLILPSQSVLGSFSPTILAAGEFPQPADGPTFNTTRHENPTILIHHASRGNTFLQLFHVRSPTLRVPIIHHHSNTDIGTRKCRQATTNVTNPKFRLFVSISELV